MAIDIDSPRDFSQPTLSEQRFTAGLNGLLVDALHIMDLAETAADAKLRWVREALALASRSEQPTARC